METVGVEPHLPRCKRGARQLSYIPGAKCGRVESNHHSAWRQALQPAELADAQRPQRKGDRPDSNRHREDHDLGCCRYTTATTKKAGTTGLEPAASRPDKRALCRLSYAPVITGCAGGIRTHGLELMRLARTASPLPRIWPAGVEPAVSGARSRRGGHSPTQPSRSTPGGTRTRSFRVEGPASSPVRPRGRGAPAAGIEPAPRD